MKSMNVDYDGNFLIVRFRGSGLDWRDTLSFVKSIPGREFNSFGKYWILPATEKNVKTLLDYGFTVTPAVSELLKEKDEIDKNKKSVITVPKDKLEGFRDYQIEGVQFLENREGTGGVFDEMGIGKTWTSLGYFIIHRITRPLVIVCKSTAKINWARHIEFLLGEPYYICRGLTPEKLPKKSVYIINYDILAREDAAERRAEAERKEYCKKNNKKYRKKEIPFNGWVDELIKLNPEGVIGDEIQMVSNTQAVMTRAFIKLIKTCKPAFIPLSGTPIRNRPLDFFVCLNLLAPKVFSNEWKYKYRYCDPKNNGFGWTFKGATNSEELHELIKPLMIRRLRKDVLPELPPIQPSVEYMEIDPIDRLGFDELSDEFKTWILENKSKAIEQKAYVSQIKQQLYLAKRKSVINWINGYLDSGSKLVVFAYHRKVIDDLYNVFKTSVKLYGGLSESEKQEAIDSFQNDDKVQLFIGQTTAAGDSIDLTASPAVAFVEYPDTATQVRQCEDRVARIGQKAQNIFSYHLITEDTFEMELVKRLQAKYDDYSIVLDGKSQGELFGDINDLNQTTVDYYKNLK